MEKRRIGRGELLITSSCFWTYQKLHSEMATPITSSSIAALSNPSISPMLTLNGTNYKQLHESLMMNLTIMKLNLALREDESAKISYSSISEHKRHREEWEHSNRCCLMIMRYHMEDSIHDSIQDVEIAKTFLESIDKKFKKFSKNERNEHLNMLHNLSYDKASGIRSHIDKAISCYRKLLTIGAKLLDDDYMVWLIMRTFPPPFDAIRSSYNAQKEQWTLEEMTAILAKDEEDIKNGRGHSVSVVSNLKQLSQKKNFPHKHSSKPFKKKATSGKPNPHAGVFSSNTKKDVFSGKCNFCHKFGHKKVEAWLEKKGLDKQKEFS